MTENNRSALVVATSRYDDPGLSMLHAPDLDAAALVEVLSDPNIGDFKVTVLQNPTCQDLRVGIHDFFEERTAEQTLLLHFSCHGVKDAAGRLFLATTDTKRNRLASTAVEAKFVSDRMQDTRAQCVAVFLDCCYAGAFGREVFTRGDSDAHVLESFQGLKGGARRGRGVFTASSAVEWVFEDGRPVGGQPGSDTSKQGNEPSLFTRSLVKGLRTGDADRDGNGEIGLSELADYVLDQVREMTPHQTPQLWLFGAHGGDLPIAYTKLRPGEIPPETKIRMESSSPEMRLWAVEDLQELLCGVDLRAALAAVAGLTRLTGDDSRRVADKADRALRTASPRVAKRSYHLGAVSVGTPGTSAVISVEGPPIVRETVEAKVEAPAENWLKTRRVASGIELSADPSKPHHYAGSVVLRTATGELSVEVEVDAVSTKPVPHRERFQASTNTTDGERDREAEIVHLAEKEEHNTPTHRRSIPFFLASLLMTVALFTPLLTSRHYHHYWIFDANAWAGGRWWVWPVLALGLATNLAVATLVWGGSASVRRLPAFWLYAAATLLTASSAIFVFFVWNNDIWSDEIRTYQLGVGGVALTIGCVVEAWGCRMLWRNRFHPPTREAGSSGR
ncbi:caspase family protein [Streptomyces yangpuensis]|uniref:caspase, EACC1-associated type n=1 Tax=Streptomyces yangpuensis TaxID=1648182 RepID=UPI0037F6CC4F